MRSLDSQKTLITGAASGIGLATARAAAAEGAVLILTDINTELLKTVVAEITAAGGRVAFSDALDVADHDAVTAFAKAVHEEVGAMDIVMNVAGISTWGRIQDLEHHHWRRTVEIDLMGPIHIMESFIPAMIEAGNGGHLVNVSSAAGLLGLPLHAPYSAAKFGLRGVSEVLR
ncbi:MAG: SDR family NAD(P)-dependent oxidoreductase, partial [Aeromicrobium sp.]